MMFVRTDAISSVDFSITGKQQDMLMSIGRRAGEKFPQNWDFEAYVERYRGTAR